jgi:predicted DNA-binding transcriptional regulator
MSRDQTIGAIILVASLIGLAVYAVLLYFYALLVLEITAFLAVAAILLILTWIGWTMATTPPPTPLEAAASSSEPTTTASNAINEPKKAE